MTLRSLADTLAVDPARSARDRASITESWDTLAGALEDDRLTEGQFAWLMEREPDLDTVDALVVNLWARTMRRAVSDPRGISANPESLVTYPCRCAAGRGWVYEQTVSPVSGLEVIYAKPCPNCNHRQRALWAGHWIEGGDHRCAECMPRGGKTPTPLAGNGGAGPEVAEERARDREAAADAILFGQDGLE